MDASSLAANATSTYVTEDRLTKLLDSGGILGWGSGGKRPIDALEHNDQPQYLLFSGGWNSHFKIQSVGGTETAGPAAVILTNSHVIFVTEQSDYRIRNSDIAEVTAIQKSTTQRKLVIRSDGRTYRMVIFHDCAGTKLTDRDLRQAIEFLHERI